MSLWDIAEADYYSSIIPLFLTEKDIRNLSSETIVIRGVAHWAKILGEPRMNDYTGEREHSIDITPNEESRKLIQKLGLSDRLRTPKEADSRTMTFLSFRQNEFRKDGTKNDPIRVVNAANEPWDHKTLIGNGSDIELKFVKRTYGPGKKAGMYIRAVRVLNLVPYVVQDFAPLDSDDEFFAAPSAPEPETILQALDAQVADQHPDLDDDVPV